MWFLDCQGMGINGIQDALRKEHSEVPSTDFPLRERIRASFDCESPSPVPVMPWFEVQPQSDFCQPS